MCASDIAEWLTGIGTLALAVVAAFQDQIRACLRRPRLTVSIKTEPPDCMGVPEVFSMPGFLTPVPVKAIYLRLWVTNSGNAPAINAEVYADRLRRRRLDRSWEPLVGFPPMNLRWADIGGAYFPRISPDMGKHCDLAKILDPKGLKIVGLDPPKEGLTAGEPALWFVVIVQPNHNGNIVEPGEYELDVTVAAENATPIRRTIGIRLGPKWFDDETLMLRDGIGVTLSS